MQKGGRKTFIKQNKTSKIVCVTARIYLIYVCGSCTLICVISTTAIVSATNEFENISLVTMARVCIYILKLLFCFYGLHTCSLTFVTRKVQLF